MLEHMRQCLAAETPEERVTECTSIFLDSNELDYYEKFIERTWAWILNEQASRTHYGYNRKTIY